MLCYRPHSVLVSAVAPVQWSLVISASLLALGSPAVMARQAAAEVRNYQIPSGPLSSVLTRFSREAGVFLVGDGSAVQGKSSPGLQGSYSVSAGFAALLQGSGLQAWLQPDGSYGLRPLTTDPATSSDKETLLPTVKVTATTEAELSQHLDRPIQAGALGSMAQKDSPYSSRLVSSEQIAQQAPTKLGELFIQDASVSDNSGAYTAWSTFLTVRGMDLDWQNSYRIDGRPFLGYTLTLPYEHMEQVEQVELLKGASGFMYGFGAPGGMLNYVTKKPTDTAVRSLSFGYASSGIGRINADLGGRLDDEHSLGYRLNATHEAGETSTGGDIRRSSTLLSFDGEWSSRLRWELQGLYQDRLTRDTEPTIATRAVGNTLPEPIDNDQRLVGPGNYVDNQFGLIAGGLTYQINADWLAQTHVSQSHSKTRRNESVLKLQNAAGDYLDDRADYAERYQYRYGDLMLQGSEQWAGMRHQLVVGLSWQKQMNDDSRNAVYIPGYGSGTLAQQNQNRYDSVGSFDSLGLYRLTEVVQKSLFASDRIELTERWSVLAGLRICSKSQELKPYKAKTGEDAEFTSGK